MGFASCRSFGVVLRLEQRIVWVSTECNSTHIYLDQDGMTIPRAKSQSQNKSSAIPSILSLYILLGTMTLPSRRRGHSRPIYATHFALPVYSNVQNYRLQCCYASFPVKSSPTPEHALAHILSIAEWSRSLQLGLDSGCLALF